MLWVGIPSREGVLDTTLCDKVCLWLAGALWLSPVSSTNKTDCHEITEILLKVVLSTTNLYTLKFYDSKANSDVVNRERYSIIDLYNKTSIGNNFLSFILPFLISLGF